VNRIVWLAESEGGALSHPVVLMHNQAIPMPATVAALPIIIRYFQSHGYTFVDLLGRTGSPGSCGGPPVRNPRLPSAVLEPGRRLPAGASVTVPSGQFRLVMQRDGNLVMRLSSGRPLWASGTEDNPGAAAVMQRDGNLVVYSASGRALWASRTEHHRGAWLAVQADANLVVYDSTGPLWSAGSVDTKLLAGERLRPGWYLQSPRRLCHLIMQKDGNLVLYAADGRALWASDTRYVASATAFMQRDGNFVIYSGSGRAAWASATDGHPGARLTAQDSARVVVTSRSGALLWSTG